MPMHPMSYEEAMALVLMIDDTSVRPSGLDWFVKQLPKWQANYITEYLWVRLEPGHVTEKQRKHDIWARAISNASYLKENGSYRKSGFEESGIWAFRDAHNDNCTWPDKKR
jgi:hypothetical protein